MGTIRWRATEGWQRAFRAWIFMVYAAWLVCPFWASGTIRWAPGWTYVGVLAGALVAHGRYVARRSPGVRRRRRTLGEGTKSWDIGWNLVFWPLMAAIAVAAGRDHAVHGPTLSLAAWPVGAALLAAGMSLSARAMVANPFFEGTMRIQREVGHRVVDVGPYRLVRHPGYVGLVAWAAAPALRPCTRGVCRNGWLDRAPSRARGCDAQTRAPGIHRVRSSRSIPSRAWALVADTVDAHPWRRRPTYKEWSA